MEEIKEVQEMKDEVVVEKEEITEDKPTPKPVDPMLEAKTELAKQICGIYNQCYQSVSKVAEGKALKAKFEAVENNLRRFKRNQQAALDVLNDKVEKARLAYNEAKREFEKISLEELDPSKYDDLVAPKEAEFNMLRNFKDAKVKNIQSLTYLITQMSAREKKQIPSLVHAQSVFVMLNLFRLYLETGEINILNASEETKAYLEENVPKVVNNELITSNLTAETPVEDIVNYFYSISQHSVDKHAERSRSSKDFVFKSIDKICEELNLQVLFPTGDMDPAEYELTVKANQLKLMERALTGKIITNPDGTQSKLVSKNAKEQIVELMKGVSPFMSGVTGILTEEFINNLPFRTEALEQNWKDSTNNVSNLVFSKVESKDTFFTHMLTAWLLFSTCTVDHIPMMLLYM